MLPKIFVIFLIIYSFVSYAQTPSSPPRWFYREGDGQLTLKNAHTGKEATLQYKTPEGKYDFPAKPINQVFALSSKKSKAAGIDSRLIALLDALQDHFGEERLLIISGYRAPEYNEGLRKQGKTAAKASLHMEGMAADVIFPKSSAKKVWNYVRGLDCCGAGYYLGKSIQPLWKERYLKKHH